MFTKPRGSWAMTIASAALAVGCTGVVDPNSPTGPSASNPQAEASAALLGQTSEAATFSLPCGAVGSGGKVTNGTPKRTRGAPPADAITGGPGGLGPGDRVTNGTPPSGSTPGAALGVSGSVTGLSGSCPSISFSVNGKAVRTSGDTSFPGGSCAALKAGDGVGVFGSTQADGSIAATCVASGH